MNISAKSEYSRLVSASLNIPDRSYCVERDWEGERATDKRKCTRFSSQLDWISFQLYLYFFPARLDFFTSWTRFSSISLHLVGSLALAGALPLLCSVYARSESLSSVGDGGGGREERRSDMCCSQKAKLSPPLTLTSFVFVSPSNASQLSHFGHLHFILWTLSIEGRMLQHMHFALDCGIYHYLYQKRRDEA